MSFRPSLYSSDTAGALMVHFKLVAYLVGALLAVVPRVHWAVVVLRAVHVPARPLAIYLSQAVRADLHLETAISGWLLLWTTISLAVLDNPYSFCTQYEHGRERACYRACGRADA